MTLEQSTPHEIKEAHMRDTSMSLMRERLGGWRSGSTAAHQAPLNNSSDR